MKKTQRILCLRYMRRQMAACVSMFIVAMLAVMAYLGINDTAQAMKNNVERFWDETGFRDIEIAASTLLSEDDLARIRQTEGVQAAEPVWYTTAHSASENATEFDVVSLTEQINTVILTEGHMPQTAEECLLEQPVLEELGLLVGDTFEIGDADDLAHRRFVVCGVAQHADHACLPIHVPGNRYMIVKKEAFDLEGLHNRCMKAVLKVEGAGAYDRFSEEYQECVAKVQDRLYLLAAGDIGREILNTSSELTLESILTTVMSREEEIRPWMVFDVWSSMYCYAIRTAVDNVVDIGKTFALMFVIVGALVIFASIHRMVEEDKRRIGTAKAMGMTKREIAARYLAAGLVPTIAGMLVGTLVGYAVLQQIMLMIYGRFYVYGKGSPAFLFSLTGIVFVAGIVIAGLAAFIACIGLIMKPALSLLSDRAWTGDIRRSGRVRRMKKPGKIRSKYRLYVRMILRQIRREKSRVLMIAVSITGCMVLLVTGFSIKFAITSSIAKQFSDVEQYDLKVRFDEATEGAMKDEITQILEAEGLQVGTSQNGWIEVLERECLYYAEDRLNGGEMLCAEPEQLDAFFRAKNTKNGESFGQSQAWGVHIPLRAAETANMNVGDPMFLLDSRMDLKIVTVADVYDNYVGGQILMSRKFYEEIYEEKPENNCILIRCGSESLSGLRSKLSQLPVTVIEKTEKKGEYMSYTSALNAVAGLLAALAAFMAGGILINLIYLQYYRRKSSLVVMRINGFTPAETAGYVLGESVITHIIGMVLGIFGGTMLSGYILRMMEGRQFHIIRSPQYAAWIVAAVILLIFSVIIHSVIVRAVIHLKPSEDVMIR